MLPVLKYSGGSGSSSVVVAVVVMMMVEVHNSVWACHGFSMCDLD